MDPSVAFYGGSAGTPGAGNVWLGCPTVPLDRFHHLGRRPPLDPHPLPSPAGHGHPHRPRRRRQRSSRPRAERRGQGLILSPSSRRRPAGRRGSRSDQPAPGAVFPFV
ncbi:hypothetical protein PVAP13_2NG510803, partial [Panicum virgatum]